MVCEIYNLNKNQTTKIRGKTMSTKLKILEIFNERGSQYISGQELADILGLSRNSVWTEVKKLQEQDVSKRQYLKR